MTTLEQLISERDHQLVKAEQTDYYYAKNDLVQVNEKLDGIEQTISDFNMPRVQQEMNDFILFKRYLQSITANSGKIENLSQEQITQLEYMATNFAGLAARQARNILCFFIGDCEELEVIIDDKKCSNNGNGKSMEVGNEEMYQTMELVILPNPNNGIFELQVPENCRISSISVVDVSGKNVNFDLLSEDGNKSVIQLANAEPGIHIIRSLCEDGSLHTGRILIVNNH